MFPNEEGILVWPLFTGWGEQLIVPCVHNKPFLPNQLKSYTWLHTICVWPMHVLSLIAVHFGVSV